MTIASIGLTELRAINAPVPTETAVSPVSRPHYDNKQ